MRAGRALAFGLPSSRRFHITYNFWAQGELHEADCYTARAMPVGSLFPVRYDPSAPRRTHLVTANSDSPAGATRARVPLLVIGIVGSVVLSLGWLLFLRGC